MGKEFNKATQSYAPEEVEPDILAEAEVLSEFVKTLIPHPDVKLDEDNFPVRMALVFSEGRTFLGGVCAAEDGMLIVMHEPLLVQEGMVQDPQTGRVHPQVGFMPMSFTTSLMDKILVRASMFYLLKSASEADRNTVAQYAVKLREFQAQSVGIIPPTGQDIANLTRAPR